MEKILLILGAGASKDIYNYFPTGLELIKEINSFLTIEKKYSYMSEDGCHLSALTNEILRGLPNCNLDDIHFLKQHLWDYVRHHEHKYLRYDYEKSISIDYFIHDKINEQILNEKSKEITQYSISYLLIGYEEAIKDILAKNPKLIHNNWIKSLSQKLSAYSMSEISKNLFVISFNYERTFAHLFSNYMAPSGNEFIQNNINYIYGSLGDLDKVPFGLKNDTTTEMTNVYKGFNLINFDREPLTWNLDAAFDKIFFLGFGYDKINLKNLNIKIFPKALKIGTGRNFNDNFRSELKMKFGIELFSGTCSELLEKYIN